MIFRVNILFYNVFLLFISFNNNMTLIIDLFPSLY